jgi:5-methylphenazine-1-carboxylate 1-monooxygenase
MMSKPKVLIAGGGIAGLATALFLHQAGIPVTVFESVKNVKPLGLGINLLPHAVTRLYKLGLADELDATGIRTKELSFYTKRGALIWSEPRGLDAGYDVPQYSIHRGDLQMILLNAVKARIGAENMLAGHHLAAFEQGDNGITARFIDKSTGAALGSYTGDVLIGAEGIISTVRETFYPDEGMPVYSGLILWRGAVESEPFLSGRTMIMAGHNTVKAVIYPISRKAAENGKALLNWVAERPVPMDLPPKKEDWNRQGNLGDFIDYFKGWQFSWLNVPELFRKTETIYEFPMIDRDPIPQWSFGRVSLLGDAAHVMRPNGSNGASQGIWDAEVIADRLSQQPDVVQALKEYEAIRLEPVSKLVLDNRKTGPERVMQMAEDACDGTCTDVCTHVPLETLEEVSRSYKKIAGFDKDTVNKQTS